MKAILLESIQRPFVSFFLSISSITVGAKAAAVPDWYLFNTR